MSTDKKGIEQKGFTIVEVILVIAIAGLIFMSVFQAYRFARKQQQITGLKQDVNLLAAAVNHCLANNYYRVADCDEKTEVIVNVDEFVQANDYDYARPAYGNWSIILVDGPVWLYNTECAPGSITAFDPPLITRFTISIWLDADRAGNRPSYCVPF